MNELLLRKLKQWRMAKAQHEGVELFRILANKTLDELAQKTPRSMSEMLSISGIKEKKFQKYGYELLAIIEEMSDEGGADDSLQEEKNDDKEEKNMSTALSVSHFLDTVNETLYTRSSRVQGEVSSVDIRGSYLFFVLKDKNDGSTINCFMWARDYALSGVKLEEGLEVIITGVPEIYKPTGRFTLRASAVELVGEGVLKNAYDKLKIQLEKDGIFSEENKRSLPEYPHTIGVITSKTGAVIHDFLNNLGKYGYHITFFDSRVEGQVAVRDIIAGLTFFEKENIDVLVIIRGGGSLESLQAFNNETIVRRVANFPVPVICGIGHDKDVPLVSLAADRLVSTPTAVTVTLNESWQQAYMNIEFLEQSLLTHFSQQIQTIRSSLNTQIYAMEHFMSRVQKKFLHFNTMLSTKVQELIYTIREQREKVSQQSKYIISEMQYGLQRSTKNIHYIEQVLKNANPERMLKLGYTIMQSGKKIIRHVKEVRLGQDVEVIFIDGVIKSKVKSITNRKK